MKKLIFLTIMLPFVCYSQKQANIWYFGEKSGLDFTTGTPVPIANGQIQSLNVTGQNSEGCSSLCDSLGNLLLYASPNTIWNRNNNPMPNGTGLLGGMSATQGVFILPKPESCNLFYVFTLDEFQNNLANGFRYSIVDMCLDNGMGDVIPGYKNILLLDSTGEKMAATYHSNGTDIWLVTRKHFTNEFYAYQITPSGISAPIISAVGWANPQVGVANAIGQMKISPDGSKLAFAVGNQTPYIVQLFDFDNTTGIVSNVLDLPTSTNSGMPYGVAFSPDNSKLYIYGPTPTGLNQFDLSSGNPTTIINSLFNVPWTGSYSTAGLQLANNGKIYVAQIPNIGVINSPNLAGSACNFVGNTISSNISQTFPSFIDNFNHNSKYYLNSICSVVNDTSVCSSSTMALNAATAASYTWSTGSNSQTINVSNSGTYWVQIQLPNGCKLTDTTHVKFSPVPAVNILKDTSFCSNTSYTLNAVQANATNYNWSTGATTPSIVPTTSGTYWVKMLINECLLIDSATINILSQPVLTTNNYTVCEGKSVTITPVVSGGTGIYTYNWGNGYTNSYYSTIPIADSIYSISITDINGCYTPISTGSITVLDNEINLPPNVSGCSPVCINLSNIPYNILSAWTWNFGDGNLSSSQKTNYCYNKAGGYNISITYTTTSGCVNTISSDSIVLVLPSPISNFSASTFQTDVFNSTINFYNESSNYITANWFFGDSTNSILQNPSHNYLSSGNYAVMLIVKNQFGCTDTTIHEVVINDVFTFYAPNTFTPNNDTYNEMFLPIGTGWDNNNFKMAIFDRWGNLILSTTNPYQGWDGRFKGKLVQEDVYVWKIELIDIFKKEHFYSGTITIVK